MRASQLYRITGRQNEKTFAVASVRDFATEFIEDTSCDYAVRNSLVYCYDPVGERVWHVLVPNVRRVLAAPFVYQAQRRFASHVLAVPVEDIERRFDAGTAEPTLVFSVGRCGSTLLSTLLRASGRMPVSEPDSLTQIHGFSALERRRIGVRRLSAIIGGAVDSYAVHCGSRPVFKLRHHCNQIWRELAGATRNARIVFMLRRWRPWVLSRHRAFGDPPDQLAKMLAQAVGTVDEMTRAGAAPQVVWYEDLIADPVAVLESLAIEEDGMGGLDAAAIRAAMADDSQAGTSASRAEVKSRDSDGQCLQEFQRLWTLSRPASLIDSLRLERLDEE